MSSPVFWKKLAVEYLLFCIRRDKPIPSFLTDHEAVPQMTPHRRIWCFLTIPAVPDRIVNEVIEYLSIRWSAYISTRSRTTERVIDPVRIPAAALFIIVVKLYHAGGCIQYSDNPCEGDQVWMAFAADSSLSKDLSRKAGSRTCSLASSIYPFTTVIWLRISWR